MASNNLPLDRGALSQVFKDPRTLRAFEEVLQRTLGTAGLVIIDGSTVFTLTGANAIPLAADDDAAAALTPPVPVGGVYLNGNVVQVRLT